MFGWFKRKAVDVPPEPEAGQGWRRKVWGVPVPAKPGQAFDLRGADGDEFCGLIAGRPSRSRSKHGYIFNHDGSCGTDSFSFRMAEGGRVLARWAITHYRLHHPVADAHRAERQAMFDYLRDNPDAMYDDARPDLDRMPEREVAR